MDFQVKQRAVGFGCLTPIINLYIANIPNLPEYTNLESVIPLTKGEIHSIGKMLGNGWRKVFNVYAKFLYELPVDKFGFSSLKPTWQEYRDNFLLQSGSQTRLLFSPPQLASDQLHVICGRTYAKQLINQGKLDANLTWLNRDFAVDASLNLIVCPYLDYRQLSNDKIAFLVKLILQLPLIQNPE